MKSFVALAIAFLTASPFAHAGGDFSSVIKQALTKMTPEERQMVRDHMEAKPTLQFAKSWPQNDDDVRAVFCAGVQGGIVAVAGLAGQCITNRGEFFSVHSLGVQLRVGASADFAVGAIRGRPQNGAYSIVHGFGAHWIAGGSYLNADPLTLVWFGVGYSGEVTTGTPSDSLFGGQLVVTTPNP